MASVKSTVEQIRERFDHDVERFSNLQTGQSATIDAPLVLELVAQAAARCTPGAKSVLDIGCGAGNYTLSLLGQLPNLDATLIDLSRPMLDRAVERVGSATRGKVAPIQGDIRDLDLGEHQCDVILAAMVLHHLREESQWRAVFAKLYRALRPGGSLWIADHIEHDLSAVQAMMHQRWGEYLTSLKGPEYRQQVFAYVEQEDTPRSLLFQVDLLRSVGFRQVAILHKHNLFAAFGAVK